MPSPSTIAMALEQSTEGSSQYLKPVDPNSSEPASTSMDDDRQAVVLSMLLEIQREAEDAGNEFRAGCLMDARVDLAWFRWAVKRIGKLEMDLEQAKKNIETLKSRLISQAVTLVEIVSLKQSLALLGKDLLEMQASRDRVLAENCAMTQEIRDLRKALDNTNDVADHVDAERARWRERALSAEALLKKE
jgi:hypothetical protein